MIADHSAPKIAESWQRCTNQYKLDCNQNLKSPRLTTTEICKAQEEFVDTFHPAESIFERLVLADKRQLHRIHATDIKGILINEYSDKNLSYPFAEHTLAVGSVLTEELVGTNAAGTCLTTKEALTVYTDEHFNSAFRALACSSAPLISPFGEVVGTLSISSLANNRSSHDWALQLACDTATEVEAAIFRSTYARYHLLNLTQKVNNKAQQAHAIIAVNDSGWIIGVTSVVLSILGIAQRELLIGQGLANILGYSLEELYRVNSLPVYDRTGWFITLLRKTRSATISRVTARQKDTHSPLQQVAGTDHRLMRNADICHKVLDKKINILLMGETGTGKEVWARAIHDSSAHYDKPFITLNCAAIPESLIESELFGYSGGTFTGGLKKGKVGKIEASHGGTLFLDEIGDMPLALQARLLRILAEGEVTPLGQLEPINVDLNIICATHRDLKQHVQEGCFREDLYYRISGVNLTLSALRERSDRIDIIKKVLNIVDDGGKISIDAFAISVLDKYQWPGNIRQLKNVIRFAVSMCDGRIIRITDLPDEVFPAEPKEQTSTPCLPTENNSSLEKSDCERECILRALQENRWVVLRAAQSLGISRSTLHRKINTYCLRER